MASNGNSPAAKSNVEKSPLPHWRENWKRNSESRRAWDREIIRYFHEYPKRATILLIFFSVRISEASRRVSHLRALFGKRPRSFLNTTSSMAMSTSSGGSRGRVQKIDLA